VILQTEKPSRKAGLFAFKLMIAPLLSGMGFLKSTGCTEGYGL
jgi:hypothetical protein